MAHPTNVEVWKNTANGMRWFQTINRQGFQQGRTVKGGRTFTITPFDRQINQDAAASPAQDHFRNGTFVLVKPAEDTDISEIESPDSLTDSEVLGIVYEVIADNITIEEATRKIKSPIALGRIREQLVLNDGTKAQDDYLKARVSEAEGTTPAVERSQVTEKPATKSVKTPRGGIPKAKTEKVVETAPEKNHG